MYEWISYISNGHKGHIYSGGQNMAVVVYSGKFGPAELRGSAVPNCLGFIG